MAAEPAGCLPGQGTRAGPGERDAQSGLSREAGFISTAAWVQPPRRGSHCGRSPANDHSGAHWPKEAELPIFQTKSEIWSGFLSETSGFLSVFIFFFK